VHRGKEWTGIYSTDFSAILDGTSSFGNAEFQEEDEDTRFSLLSGSLKRNHKKNPQNSDGLQNPTEPVGTLSTRNSSTQISSWSPATSFLQGRTFMGLEPKVGQTEVTKAVEGLSGIPKGYQGEGEPQITSNTTESDQPKDLK
jgi:diphthamide biosynthesis protein 2